MGGRASVVAAIAGAAAMCVAAGATSGQDLSGKYETLDGKVQHVFQPSAVYSAKVFMADRILSFDGLYQQGDNVCLAGIQGDATGGVGNLLLYIGENECCLEVRRIADKFAVTKIGMTGDQHGPGFFLCNHQFLKRNRLGDATASPSTQPASPRKLHP